jgi:hypothetical protein
VVELSMRYLYVIGFKLPGSPEPAG